MHVSVLHGLARKKFSCVEGKAKLIFLFVLHKYLKLHVNFAFLLSRKCKGKIRKLYDKNSKNHLHTM